MTLPIIVFVVTMIIGVPIAVVIGLAGLVHLLSTGDLGLLHVIPQRLFSNVDSFTLLAIPFFIFAGELMNTSGITKRLMDLSRSFIGYLRGGIGYVNVFLSLFLGAILGSANAEAVIRGLMVVLDLREVGYVRSFFSVLTAISSIIAPIFSPSLILIIYGVAASTSIGALFLAGIIPAIFVAVAHIIVVALYVRKRKTKLVKHDFTSFFELFCSFVSAITALLIS